MGRAICWSDPIEETMRNDVGELWRWHWELVLLQSRFIIFIKSKIEKNKIKGEDIQHYICRQRVLKPDDTSCLDEEWTGKEVKQVDEDAELAKDLEKAKKEEL